MGGTLADPDAMRPRARAPGAHTLATASTAACASASAFTEVSVCQGAMPLDAAQATDGLGQGRGLAAGHLRPPSQVVCAHPTYHLVKHV